MTGVVNELSAYLYDGKTAERKAVTIKLTLPGYIVIQELGALARYRLEDVSVSDRLGSQPARVELPDGGRLEIPAAEDFYTIFAASSAYATLALLILT